MWACGASCRSVDRAQGQSQVAVLDEFRAADDGAVGCQREHRGAAAGVVGREQETTVGSDRKMARGCAAGGSGTKEGQRAVRRDPDDADLTALHFVGAVDDWSAGMPFEPGRGWHGELGQLLKGAVGGSGS